METAGHAGEAGGRFANRPVPRTPGISLPFALALQRLLRPNRLWYALAVQHQQRLLMIRLLASIDRKLERLVEGLR